MTFRTLIDCWNRYWFKESTGLNLAICRILVVGANLLFFFPDLNSQLGLLENFDHFRSPPASILLASLVIPESILRTPEFITILHAITFLAGILVVIGLWTRLSAAFFAFGFLFLITHTWSYGEFHHSRTLSTIFFLLLPFSPCGMRLSLDAYYRHRKNPTKSVGGRGRDFQKSNEAMWALKLIQILFAIVYFNAAYLKLQRGGLEWLNGYAIQGSMLKFGLYNDYSHVIWLAKQHWICVILSIGTILFEGAFFTGLIWRKSLPYWLLFGVVFHLGLYFFMEGSIAFLSWIILYLTFIDYERLGSHKKWFFADGAMVMGKVESS